MISIIEASNILNDFRTEWINDKFETIKNINMLDHDVYSGDIDDLVTYEFNSEYEKKLDDFIEFIYYYDKKNFYDVEIDMIIDAHPFSDEESILLAFKYLRQYINNLEAEQKMGVEVLSKD